MKKSKKTNRLIISGILGVIAIVILVVFGFMNHKDSFRVYTLEDIFNGEIGQVGYINNGDEEDYTKVSISMNSSFKLTNKKGKTLIYDREKISGDLPIYSLDVYAPTGEPMIIIKTDNSRYFELSEITGEIEIDIMGEINYMSLETSNIDSVLFDMRKNKINIKGNDYNFEAYIGTDYLVDEDEEGLVSVSANAKSDVLISAKGKFVNVKSNTDMTDVKCTSLIGADTFTKEYTTPISKLKFSCAYKGEE